MLCSLRSLTSLEKDIPVYSESINVKRGESFFSCAIATQKGIAARVTVKNWQRNSFSIDQMNLFH
jgi:hypothetical protein